MLFDDNHLRRSAAAVVPNGIDLPGLAASLAMRYLRVIRQPHAETG